MFLYYVPESRYAPSTGPGKWIARDGAGAGDDGKVPYGAYIAMKTAQGYVVPWLASQTDMISDDWKYAMLWSIQCMQKLLWRTT